MKAKILPLSRIEFSNSREKILFSDEEVAKRYAQFVCGDKKLRLSWSSETIEPNITQINEDLFAIGIDLHFGIVDCDCNIRLYVPLDYYFMETIVNRGALLVCTQLEIIIVELSAFGVRERQALPNFFERALLKGNVFEIKTVESDTIMLKV